MKPDKKMTHTFFIAANKAETIASSYLICNLSPPDREIFSFWFISPCLPVSANNLSVFRTLPAKFPRLKYFAIFLFALCFVTVYFKNFL